MTTLERQVYNRKHYAKNRAKVLARTKEYAKLHREEGNAGERRRYAKNPEHHRRQQRNWYARNRKKAIASVLKYRLKHLEDANARARKWQAHKTATDPNFRIRKALRGRIYCAIKGKARSASTMRLLGCSLENFWIHLESKFDSGMTRGNYGKVWHVDHIMPCAIFDLSKPEHQRRCFHFSNLQPLFGSENFAKGAKIVTNQFQLL